MSDKPNYAAQTIKADFGDEVPYAFDYLPINKRLNDEMFARAVERAKRRSITEGLPEIQKEL